jgi:hypothetical protein
MSEGVMQVEEEGVVEFDPSRHTIKVQGGKDYLPVSARLKWFREKHPDWGIVTTPVEINLEKQYAIFNATIFNADGKVMATATKMENVRGFGDYLEKAETGSVGRALSFCGFGTSLEDEKSTPSASPQNTSNRSSQNVPQNTMHRNLAPASVTGVAAPSETQLDQLKQMGYTGDIPPTKVATAKLIHDLGTRQQ